MSIYKFATGILAVAIGGNMLAHQHKSSQPDWPMWGGTIDRNMVGHATGLPVDVEPGDFKQGTDEIDLSTTKNVHWVAKLGSQAYGNPAVGGGKVFVGTNNESPRDAKQQGDRGVLMAFDQETGDFVWQLLIPKLGAGKVSDWERRALFFACDRRWQSLRSDQSGRSGLPRHRWNGRR